MSNGDFSNEYGHGIICPFQRDGKGDFAHADGLDLLRSDIGELIGVIGPTTQQPGELPWNTELGSRVLTMKHRGLHAEMIRATADQLVSAPVRMWEKRARARSTEVVVDENSQSLRISFSYVPIGKRSTGRFETYNFEVPGTG
jgi:hypothetical protein